MSLPLEPPFAPMEAEPAEALPPGAWQYEPKWDGMRCLVFRDDEGVFLQAKTGEPLARYFPEVESALVSVPGRFVLDGQLVISRGGRFSLQWLRERMHPSAVRVDKLSHEAGAGFVAFDMLVDPGAGLLVERKLSDRRRALEAFAERHFTGRDELWLSPASRSRQNALEWLESEDTSLDGVLAKRLDSAYLSADKSAARTVAVARTASCVVGGLRWSASGDDAPDALLLGLWGPDNLLHHVGFAALGGQSDDVLKHIRPLLGGGGFTGRVPGEPSRWGSERSGKWEPVRPELAAEVRYGHFDGERFRERATLLRLPADAVPRACGFEQLRPPGDGTLLGLLAKSALSPSAIS